MVLRDILQKLVEDEERIWLSDRKGDWNASDLLTKLSEPMLKRQAHLQPGLYIALINDGGYLGEVLYRVKSRA
ncbi:MAG: hypothetical protein JXB23_00055 [Candidatus Aminicenantes bacterium]|nr:hypothetical protein [Candidatus Aminicenantes bacterium]